MYPVGTANPVEVQSWLGVYHSCSYGPLAQDSNSPGTRLDSKITCKNNSLDYGQELSRDGALIQYTLIQ